MSLSVYLIKEKEEVYADNITHNLGRMADEAGIIKPFGIPKITKIKRVI